MKFSRPPTVFDWALAVYFIAALMIGFGVVGLVAAHRAAPEKAVEAAALAHHSWWVLGTGLGVALVFWLFRKFTD